MPAYETVVFDLDGTLLNTIEDLHLSTNAALAAHGMPQHTLDDVRRFVGNGIRKLIERAVPAGTSAAEQDAVYEDFCTHYAAHCEDHTGPYPGIPELLAHLRAAGVRLAVVSNKGDFAVQELIARQFSGAFDAVLGENEAAGIRKKPRAGHGGGSPRADGCHTRQPCLHRRLRGGRPDRSQRRLPVRELHLGIPQRGRASRRRGDHLRGHA